MASRCIATAAAWLAPMRGLAWVALGVAMVVSPASAQPAAAAPPPIEAFYRHPDLDDAQLSPSGRRLAVTANVRQRRALVVFDLKSDAPPQVLAQYTDADVAEFHWVNDERLVYDIIELDAGGGDQRWAPGLFTVALDGQRPRRLVRTGWDFVTEPSPTRREPLEWNHRLLAVPRGGGNEVIVGKLRFNTMQDLVEVQPLALDVVTQRAHSLAEGAPRGARRWLLDPAGALRLAEVEEAGQVTLHWRGPGDAGWRVLARFPALQAAFKPVSVDEAGQLYVLAVEPGPAGTQVLKRFDFATGQPRADSLVRTPGFDFTGRLVQDLAAPPGAPPLGVRVITDAETTVWFQPRLTALQQAVDARLTGRTNRLQCRDCLGDDAVVLVKSWSDQDPGQYWVHRPKSGQWQAVGRVREAIDARRMATLDLHRVKARDGLEIPVWLTLPLPAAAAATPPAPRPAVVLVHGGPWARHGHWRWDADAQFLASRGYVVIEPEFRGSTGYGQRLFQAGWRQWGQAMQDDVADALQWAVAQGHVDPKRVCIAGASYGGYATLMGLVRHPDLYRCGIAWVAVSDPRLLFGLRHESDISDEARGYSFPQLIGDPVADADMLARVAPLAQAGRIRAPLLLAYGAKDRRVPLTHGEQMRDALIAAGRPPEWVVYPDEGHGWLRPDNRFDFARRVERFLAQHLAPAP